MHCDNTGVSRILLLSSLYDHMTTGIASVAPFMLQDFALRIKQTWPPGAGISGWKGASARESTREEGKGHPGTLIKHKLPPNSEFVSSRGTSDWQLVKRNKLHDVPHLQIVDQTLISVHRSTSTPIQAQNVQARSPLSDLNPSERACRPSLRTRQNPRVVHLSVESPSEMDVISPRAAARRRQRKGPLPAPGHAVQPSHCLPRPSSAKLRPELHSEQARLAFPAMRPLLCQPTCSLESGRNALSQQVRGLFSTRLEAAIPGPADPPLSILAGWLFGLELLEPLPIVSGLHRFRR